VTLAGCPQPASQGPASQGPASDAQATTGSSDSGGVPGGTSGGTSDGKSGGKSDDTAADGAAPAATASAEDVAAARKLLDDLGAKAKYEPKSGALLREIAIQDGASLSPDAIALLGRLSDLEKLQIFNYRELNDEMAAQLAPLKKLSALALTNSVINDGTVDMIVKSFPDLVELDLSSNTNMSSGVLKQISQLAKLQRLTLVQNQFNDIGAQQLPKLANLRSLDLRGNMEAGDMTMEVVGALPKLSALKHRSTAVTDFGLEKLCESKTLDSLLLQDFIITDQGGAYLAKLPKLSQLEIFRCQGFGSEGVLALKGLGLTRLTLRDLPNVDDRALEVLAELPKLRRLYLHELSSVGDNGLAQLGQAKSLELLDIWSVPQMTDASVAVIAKLANLKELSLRATGISDAAIDTLLGMAQLQSLTLKENGSVTEAGLKKLKERKWTKLEVGSAGGAADAASQ
jgi:Leucine-rich repeat (LRR) protein